MDQPGHSTRTFPTRDPRPAFAARLDGHAGTRHRQSRRRAGLTLLTAELGDDRWPRAAARWLGRFIGETPAMTIGEAGLAAAIQQFPDEQWGLAAETLRRFASKHGHATVARVLESAA